MDTARDELATIIEHLHGKAPTEKLLEAWSRKTSVFDELGDAIFVPAVMADMAGQLMVKGHEAKLVHLDADTEIKAFLDLPWEEALREWRARGLQSDSEFETMLKDYAQRSDVARSLMLEHLQEMMRTKLDDAIADGQSYKDFADSVREGTTSLGITEADPAYLTTVFRTNMQNAYGAGRYRAMTDPDVMELRPYAEYRTVGDALVRPNHAALEGCVFEIGTSTCDAVTPPGGYNCRCSMVTLSREEADGRKIWHSIPPGGQPDTGFGGPPVAEFIAEGAANDNG